MKKRNKKDSPLSVVVGGSRGERQGDVWLRAVSKEMIVALGDGNLSATRHSELTLALGEATGHHHTLYKANQTAEDIEKIEVLGRTFINIPEGYFFRHQEHNPEGYEMLLPPGWREVTIEESYDPFKQAFMKVAD